MYAYVIISNLVLILNRETRIQKEVIPNVIKLSKNGSSVTLYLIIFTLCVSLLGCGSRRTFETQAPTQNLASYILLEIPDFHTEQPNVPQDLLWTIPNQIAKEMKEENIFAGVSRAPLDISEGVLILDGTIVEVKPKEWYRQLVENAKIVVRVRLIDKQENIVIAEAFFEGTAKWGILGGARVFADMRLIDEIVDYLKQNYPTPRRIRQFN